MIRNFKKLPKSRKEAKNTKNKFYYTGKKCINGHLDKRDTKYGACNKCKVLWNINRRKKYSSENVKNNRSENFINFWAREARGHCRTRAKKKDLPFNLEASYIKSIMVTHCPVLGIELDYSLGNKGHAQQNSPSIDRIVPELGYIEGNIIIVSYRANSLRQDATIEELTQVRDFYEKLHSNR